MGSLLLRLHSSGPCLEFPTLCDVLYSSLMLCVLRLLFLLSKNVDMLYEVHVICGHVKKKVFIPGSKSQRGLIFFSWQERGARRKERGFSPVAFRSDISRVCVRF